MGALVLLVLGALGLHCAPNIELTISDGLPDTGECPYLVSLPASDSLCVAADHLAHRRGYHLVKFHLVRDAHSQRLAILGCADSSCSSLPVASSASLVSADNSWSCCSPSSYFDAPHALLSSLDLPSACYRVHCISTISNSLILSNNIPTLSNNIPTLSSNVPSVSNNIASVSKTEEVNRVIVIERPLLPWRAGQQLGEQLEMGIVEFIVWKFDRFHPTERAVFLAILFLFMYLSLRGYYTIRNRRIKSLSADNVVVTGVDVEVEQPFEVALSPGEGDSVEFLAWQNESDLAAFNRKLSELKHRVSKLPFAHASDATGGEGGSVVFLGRNVDEPKLVFRNPRTEKQQRTNIPVYTQGIRNAVVASIVRDTPGFKAYVPRAVVGRWNKVEGVFQEFVPMAKSVSLQDFKDTPSLAVDLALLVLLLRDTDAHEGNYARDPRRKIALYDLGCALGDRPLSVYDRECLDNFEVLVRVPGLLDREFEERHVEFLRNIDFSKGREMWKNFSYDNYIVNKVERKRRERASSSVFPVSAVASPRSLPTFFGLLSPRMRPVDLVPGLGHVVVGGSSSGVGNVVVKGGSGESSSTSTSNEVSKQEGVVVNGVGVVSGGSQLGSPKSARSLPTSEFFPTGWEEEEEEEARVSSVLDMLRVMEMHRNFLLRCAETKKTMLFAAKVMYSGFYDERWLELGGRTQDVDLLELELLKVASADLTHPPTLHLGLHSDDLDLDEAAVQSSFL